MYTVKQTQDELGKIRKAEREKRNNIIEAHAVSRPFVTEIKRYVATISAATTIPRWRRGVENMVDGESSSRGAVVVARLRATERIGGAGKRAETEDAVRLAAVAASPS